MSSSFPFPEKLSAPSPKKVPHELKLHGDVRVDPYFWMKKRDSAEVIAHLKDENEYFEKMTQTWNPLKKQLFQEMRARVKEDESTPPFSNGPWLYYVRYETGKEYPIFCRKLKTPPAKEEITLDVNLLAKGQAYTAVASVEPSPDHNWLVYGVDHVGRRFYSLEFKNLKTGEVLSKKIENTTGEVVWANDNSTLFFTRQNPETLRSERVFRTTLSASEPVEVYYEQDPIFDVAVHRSISDQYLFIQSSSFDSSEVRFLSADTPLGQWTTFLPREHKHEYSLQDGGDGFYILTNWKAENFRLMKAPHNVPHDAASKAAWQEILPHQKNTLMAELLVLKNHWVLRERTDGLTQLRMVDRKTGKSKFVKFPDPTYVVDFSTNEEYDTETFRYDYQSLVRPRGYYDYHFATEKSELLKETAVPTYVASDYESERVWAKASDGTRIPVSLVYKKGFKRDGTHPLLVYGYGSYGLSSDPNFRISTVSLLDRGFVYAIAHIRGGSEMGRSWYEQGRMGHKKNTFSDFNAVTEHLVHEKYGDPKRVFAMGGSAGGLLMGAIANARPELYRGIVSIVPFLDVLTTMLDPEIPLTTAEYEQWGNPNEKAAYDYIKSYSPYDNLSKQPYPATLVMTGYHDSQVQYWEPAKYVAKLRDFSTSGEPVLFRIDMNAGHSGASGRFQLLHDLAIEYSFIIKLSGG